MGMALNAAASNAAVVGITSLVTHIALVNGSNVEVGAARIPTSWGAASTGAQKIAADLTFSISAGQTVAGWRGFSALTGGTNYDGGALTAEAFAGAGQYVLQAVSTGYTVA